MLRNLIIENLKHGRYTQRVWKNKFTNLFSKKVENRYLFVLSPPFCGSTLLTQILSTSNFVSVNNSSGTCEGQKLPSVRKIMFDHKRRWDETFDFDWKLIKNEWRKYWQLDRPLLLEKSPPNILRAESIEKIFSPSYFIILYRNPYAHIVSLMMRKNNYEASQAAEDVIKFLSYQKKNILTLKNMIHFSYEQLTDDPYSVYKLMKEMLPQLSDIDLEKDFTAHNHLNKKMKITNLNERNISSIKESQLKQINSVLTEKKDILDFFKYKLIESILEIQN